MVQALLTAQRARKVAVMRRLDVKDYLGIPSQQKGSEFIDEQRNRQRLGRDP